MGTDTLRIYLVWQHPLLRDAVLAILQQVGLGLVGECHGLEALEQVPDPQPDVILFEAAEGFAGQLLALLPQWKATRLVCVNMADNRLHLFHHEERLLRQPEDLLAALSG